MKEDLHKTIEYRGYNINIYRDPNPESPREWDNLGTFYTAHRRYCVEKQFDRHFDINEVFERRWEFSKEFEREYIALNIFMYDHSGQTISSTPFGCPWDSGWFGMVAVEVEKVKKEFGWKKLTAARRKKIENYLQGEIETYDNYLTGEVFGYQLTKIGSDEEIDSCWGYYGESGLEQLTDECKDYINRKLEEEARQRIINYWQHALQLCLPFPEFAIQ